MASPAPIVYLNGQYTPLEQASVPLTDRGLLFGDSVYEVIPVYAGKPFRLEHHLNRLNKSLEAIQIPPQRSNEEWKEICSRLCDQLPHSDQSLYIQITRGAYDGRTHALPEKLNCTIIAFTSEAKTKNRAIIAAGQKAITHDDIRWHRCDIKATALLANVLMQSDAHDANADEAILIRNGQAKEGTATNLFIVKHGLIVTPPNSNELLAGVTRDLVIELIEEAGLPFAHASISEKDLLEADEIWLTSSLREVAPIIELNGKAVGNGQPGPIWLKINQLYQACVERLRANGECHD